MQSLKLGKLFSLNEVFQLCLGAGLLASAGLLHTQTTKPLIIINKQDSALNINQNILLTFNMGNKRLISDLLWIQTLLESDEEHYKKRDLNSWMYHRFWNISIMDPLFYENYMYGGLYLSIVKDDVIGAVEIFEKGLTHYPEDYKLNYYSGFNYYFEQGNFEKGLKYMEKIQHHEKAPAFLKNIVTKIKYKLTDDYGAALEFLKFELEDTRDEVLKRKLTKDIYALKAEHDLDCLNSDKKDCNKTDYEGNAYIFKNSKWLAPKEFKPYKIYVNK